MKEYYLPVKGFEDRYEVSNYGNVRSLLSGNLRKPIIIFEGKYKTVRMELYKDGMKQNFTISRLVYSTFASRLTEENCIYHIDGDHTNNQLTNLMLFENSSKLLDFMYKSRSKQPPVHIKYNQPQSND